VTADSSTAAAPWVTVPSAGIIWPLRPRLCLPAQGRCGYFLGAAVIPQADGQGVPAGAAQAVRLGLAAPFGQGLGEIREEDRGPQPQADLPCEGRRAGPYWDRSVRKEAVVSRLPTPTTNMTGFFATCAGRAWQAPSSALRTTEES
jgi:hypothetical protein